jgi:hypothetical protein
MTFNFYIVFLGFMSESPSLPRPHKSATQSPVLEVPKAGSLRQEKG